MFEAEKVSVSSDLVFHRSCLSCAGCGAALELASAWVEDGAVYCRSCCRCVQVYRCTGVLQELLQEPGHQPDTQHQHRHGLHQGGGGDGRVSRLRGQGDHDNIT